MALMHDVHLRDLDLNLLLVLDALLAAGSATAAARQLGLTQSAVSHALGRLRDALGDPLLVRGGRGLVPTPRGEALRVPLRRALSDLDGLLRPRAFDPAHAAGTLTLAVADYGALILVPDLALILEREAPGLDLRIRPMPPSVPEALEDGLVDLVVDVPVPAGEGLFAQRIAEDAFVCALRDGHPALQGPWTLEVFASLRHILIAPRGAPGGPVDRELAALGRSRKVAITVPHFLAAPHVVAATDAILTLPARLAARLGPPLGLVLRDVPLPLQPFAVHQVWHARRHADPAARWLRERLAATARAPMPTDPRPAP